MDTVDTIISALKKVPEKKLAIIELANQIPIVDGTFDPRVLSDKATEVKLAVDEATAYGTHTINAVNALIAMKPAKEE